MGVYPKSGVKVLEIQFESPFDEHNAAAKPLSEIGARQMGLAASDSNDVAAPLQEEYIAPDST
jgi:hypothetical protein